MSKKYIGVDLGAWLSKKTSIAVLTKDKDEIILGKIEHEPLSKSHNYLERDDALVKKLKELADNKAVIAIDAPFSIPSALKNNREVFYKLTKSPSKKYKQINNPYLFDNSARFVLDMVDEIVLAPCATLVGAYTARMTHIFNNKEYLKELNPIIDTSFSENLNSVKTIEVYPRATPKKILQNKNIPQYKNNKSDDYFNKNENKMKMLKILEEFNIQISEDVEKSIKSDDDYDAIICALTAYLVSEDNKYGYERPAQNDINKFINSFIYIPKVKS